MGSNSKRRSEDVYAELHAGRHGDKYIPLKAISQMEESFRVISAGHCVPVREKRPELDLITEAGTVHISLEKQASMQKLLEILRKSRES